MNVTDFIATLSSMEPEAALAAIEQYHDDWTARRADLIAQRAALPRADRKTAADLSAEIVALEAALHDLKFHRTRYRGLHERQQQHGLWAEAVIACAGPKALADCQAFMKTRRREVERARAASREQRNVPVRGRPEHRAT